MISNANGQREDGRERSEEGEKKMNRSQDNNKKATNTLPFIDP
jgi:hypothetical protein